MYPQYWTPGIGGIFMRYSYEYKKMCVELYRQGKWVETPEGVKEKNFRDMIQIWARTEESCGVEALRHKNQNKVWTAEEKYELVAKVLAGESNRTTAIVPASTNIECFVKIDSLLDDCTNRGISKS